MVAAKNLYSSSVEQLPSKQWVAGSIPATKKHHPEEKLKKVVDTSLESV
jgi:hypothetical protein